MKQMICVLCLCILLPVCLAEGPKETSHTEEFLSHLSGAWDSLLGMAGDAGQWASGKAQDFSAWLEEVDLEQKLKDWFDGSGIAEWAQSRADEIQAFIDENRPALEAWLDSAGENVQKAWDTIANAGEHTKEELAEAYDTLMDSLNANS